MSDWIIYIFVAEFAILSGIALFEGNYGMALYGFGGSFLNVGILIMNHGVLHVK